MKALASLQRKEESVQVKFEAKIKDLELKLLAKDTVKSVYIPPATSSSSSGLSTCPSMISTTKSCSVTSARIINSQRFHNSPSTSPDSSVLSIKTGFLPSQGSNLKTSPMSTLNWISSTISQTIPVSNTFQVLDPDSGSGTPVESDVQVDEDNNFINDTLEKVKVEVEKMLMIENQTLWDRNRKRHS